MPRKHRSVGARTPPPPSAWEIPTSGSHVTELCPEGRSWEGLEDREGQECVSSLENTELTLWHTAWGL